MNWFAMLAKANNSSLSFQFHIPLVIMSFAFSLLGRKKQFAKLAESLEVDSSKASLMYGWKPKYSTQELLENMYKGSMK